MWRELEFTSTVNTEGVFWCFSASPERMGELMNFLVEQVCLVGLAPVLLSVFVWLDVGSSPGMKE